MAKAESQKSRSALLRFIEHEATAGLILTLAAAAAIIVSNIGFADTYHAFLDQKVSFGIGSLTLTKTLHHFINDGMMALFFFLVGLEIKREVMEGHLSSLAQITLPAIAAVGGVVAPALIYWWVNHASPETLSGWAIPAATDIAFALGALALAGSRVPLSLKVFLLTLATFDDLAAIVIIALFYTADLSVASLMLALAALAVLVALNRFGVERTAPYAFVAFAMWVFVLKSGVHATLAGVAAALTIPLRHRDGSDFVHALEEGLHPYVKFLILPLFAFANAGIPLEGFSLAVLAHPVPLGVAAGLVLGKPLGIMLATAAVVLSGLAALPEGAGWRQMFGVSLLAGIGFTMSLFIGALAFATPELNNEVRVGVITGSLIATALGMAVLLSAPGKARGSGRGPVDPAA